ncbi:carboxypeptidase regulatory-like domain-containing protein [Silvibacterium sp.]|uniref:TonB-dependent receptor n=1 Tax=Silvibacterium sp. TaxID=1964179 RepID=UPI0039E41465
MARYAARLSFFALLALCCTTLQMNLLAQAGRGSVSGTVADSGGAVIPKATITLKSAKTGQVLSATTTDAGVYTFVAVDPGVYQLTARHDGFETSVQKNVRVTVDQATSVNVRLAVGSLTQTVTVDASASPVDTSSATVGQLIGAETIDRVPLLTRDVYQLVQLSAGVAPANGTPNASDTPGIFNARSLIDVSSYTINGSLQGNVFYMVDGSPIGIAENNVATIMPAFQVPEDGVDEFRMETQNTPASYASGGGGVISLVTKSGGNKLHGDAFGYFRPNALAANDFFYKRDNPGAAPLDFHRYQEGGAISGPLFRDKLFYFGDYEATQQEQLENGYYTVPTSAERTGDFSADSITIYNPLVPDNADGTRQAFSGNVIPAANLDPVAQYFASKLPLPNLPGDGPYHTNNYTGSGLDPQNAQKFDIRIDYALNEKNKLFGRFSYGRLDFGNADLYGADNMFDPNYYVNITNTRNVALGDDITLSKSSLLQLRYSFTRHYEDQTGDPRQNGYDITAAGFPASLASEVLYKQIPVMVFGTTASVGGTGNEDTFIFASENSDVNATYTKLLSKHELSVGFEWQKKYMNIGQPVSPAGSYTFDNTATSSTTFAGDGSDFASFLLGMGSIPGGEGDNFTKDVFAAGENPYYAAFLQDVFHVTPHLTINAGLRWEIFGGRTERFNRQEWFDPSLQYSLDGVGLTGGEQFTSSSHRTPFDTNWKDIGPRASFAWEAKPGTVVRGGAGIYYGPSTTMVGNPAFNSDGFGSNTTWNATEYNDDGNTVMVNPLSNPFPNGVVEPTGSTLGAATNIGVGLSTVIRNPRTLTTYNYNLGVEQQLPGRMVFTLAYVGSRGLFLPMGSVDLNTLSIGEIARYGGTLCVDSETNCEMVANTWEPILPATNPYYGASQVPLWLSLEPYPQFNNGSFGSGVTINGYPGADSSYNSMQTKLEKQLSNHFSTIASFTWAKLMTNDSQTPLGFVGYHSAGPQDWRNLNLERAVSSQDVKLQFNWQASYELPIGKGRLINLHGMQDSLLGGWTVNTILYLSTGVPIASPTGTGNPYFNQRVNLACNPGAHAQRSVDEWFSYACFSQPASNFVAGTAPAYLSSIRTDGAHSLDASLYKGFAMPGERNLRLEVSAYNVTNTVQMGYPNVFWNPAEVTDPSVMAGFGQILAAANQPRQLQFGARFTF